MNYLMINGSSRKGNTWTLAERLKLEMLARSPEAVFDEIHLTELQLPFCTGCSLCFRKGAELCPHYGIMREIITKIEWSDAVIFASATFNMQPTALTKNLLDHLCYMLHRPFFFTKKAIVLSTVGGVGVNKALGYLSGTLLGIGFNRCYKLPVCSYSWNDYEVNDKAGRKCAKLARKVSKDVKSGKLHPPKLLTMIPYNLFRGMSLAYVPGTEYETLDGIHWTEPVRSKRGYDSAVPLPFYKKPFGGLFYFIGKAAGRFINITYKK